VRMVVRTAVLRFAFDLPKKWPKFLILFGGRTRTRTWDPLIKSQRLKCPGLAQTSNNIIQKELAFLRNQSSTCIQFRAIGALRDPAPPA
jgi:hypothetical protein